MKIHARLLVLVVVWLLNATAQAAQPHIGAAEDRLRDALRHVVKSNQETPKKHLNDALNALGAAKVRLEGARKNKGSHTAVAIEKIAQAETEVTAAIAAPVRREKAAELIKEALKEVQEARRAGAK